MHVGNASLLEILRVAVAFVGLLLTGAMLRDARDDLLYHLLSGINGRRQIAARSNLRRERVRCGVMLVFLVMGIVAMASPPARPGAPSVQAWVATWGLVAAMVLIVLDAWWDRRVRRRLWALEEAEEAARVGGGDAYPE